MGGRFIGIFFLVLCFWAINKSNLKIYLISSCLGVLTKEIILFTIPVLIISELSKIKVNNSSLKKNLGKCIIVILPCIIIYFTLQFIITPDPIYPYSFFGTFFSLGIFRIYVILTGNFETIYGYFRLCTTITWGYILLICIFFNKLKSILNWIKLYGIYMLIVYFQFFLATDITRTITIGFYPIIVLSLSGMNRLSEKKEIYKLIFFSISNVYFVIIVLINHIVCIAMCYL